MQVLPLTMNIFKSKCKKHSFEASKVVFNKLTFIYALDDMSTMSHRVLLGITLKQVV